MASFRKFAGLALLPVATATHAQSLVAAPGSVAPLQGVTDRPHPDYDPIGGRLGSFFLYPRLDASVIYTDNLRATQTDNISDATFDMRPSVDLVSNWSRDYLDTRVFYDKAFHATTSSENYDQYGASAASRLDFGRDTHLFLSGNASHSVEPRTDINSINAAASPISYANYGAGANLVTTFNRLTLSGTTSVNLQRFEDAVTASGAPLDQQYRNNTVLDVSLEGRYQLGVSTSAILHIERSQIDYTDNQFTGFDRNSVAYTIQAGLGLRITDLIQGDVRVGYLTQNNKDPRFLDTSGIALSVNLTYNVTPTTTIRLFADRSIEPGGSTLTTGNIRSTGSVTVEHELLRNLILTGNVRYSSIDPQTQTTNGNPTELEERVGMIYYLSRRFRFNAGIDHYARRGFFFGQFDVTTANLGVTITL